MSSQKTGKTTGDEKPTTQPAGDRIMQVKVYSPFRVYFDEPALSITGVNETGPFDILPRHHNFMALLSEGDLIVRAPRGEQKIKISRGIMHVKADKVIVFLDV